MNRAHGNFIFQKYDTIELSQIMYLKIRHYVSLTLLSLITYLFDFLGLQIHFGTGRELKAYKMIAIIILL